VHFTVIIVKGRCVTRDYLLVNILIVQCRGWLRHCATSRKVADSIPDGAIGILHWHNLSGRTMALGSTQPLTEMSTRNISWGVKATIGTFMCRLSWNLGASTSRNPQGMSRLVMGLLYLLQLYAGVRGATVGWSTALQAGRWHCDPGVDSASNRNEYQEYFLEGKGGRYVELTTLPPSCPDCLEIWGPHPSGTLRACPGL
jgi:hypothetical protein